MWNSNVGPDCINDQWPPLSHVSNYKQNQNPCCFTVLLRILLLLLKSLWIEMLSDKMQQYAIRCAWGAVCRGQRKSKVLCSIAVQVMISASESVILCVVFNSSHVSLKICEAKCVPRDPTTMHPSLFKGPTSHLYWLGLTCSIVCCGLIS